MTEQVITKDQIRQLILAEKIQPSDLFGVEALTSDPAVKGFVETEKRSAVAGEYAHRKRTEEGFDKTRAELEKKLQEREAEIGSFKKEAAKLKVGDLFAKKRQERKLDERQAKFVEKQLAKFDPKDPDKLEAELDSYLDAQVDEYGKLAKEIFGIEDKPEGENGKDMGAGPQSTPDKQTANKYLDPARNPFIKLD